MKTKQNTIMFYTYSLLKFEFLLDKELDDNENILLEIMTFIKSNAGIMLNKLSKIEINNIDKFKNEEKVLNITKINYVDFIFAISLFSVFISKNKEVFDEKTEFKIIHICNLFFQTLEIISKNDKDLLSKIEDSVKLSYQFLEENNLVEKK